jgi:hypothetical protein
MRKEKPVLNDNLFPIDDLFYAVLHLIENNIVGFQDELKVAISEYKEHDEIEKENLEQEDDITIILRRFLNDLDSEFDFEFQTKSPEKMGGTDIGILRKYSKPRHIPFCIIEAKRLPTPIKGKKRQETEYVCYKNATKQGGIERFKTGKHGNKLPLSIMVGYIQKENANHWFTKVNEWIAEQIQKSSNENIYWIDEHLLSMEVGFSSNSKLTKYKSIHSRINLEKIKLIHYWIDLK